jgi:protein involved in polysaccharide export with SLBB domain
MCRPVCQIRALSGSGRRVHFLRGKNQMNFTRGWVVAALLIGPAGSALAQLPAPPPNDQALRPGDAVRITVWRHPEMSGEFVVATDSSLVHPLYQGVKVGGVPLSVVKERLRVILATYEQEVQLVVEPLLPVTVAGEVRQPTLYRLPQGTTFAQAIAMAGGPTEQGRLDKVRVIRRDSEILMDLAGGYSKYEALAIASGDQVLVGRRSNFNVLRDFLVPVSSVTGAVVAVLVYSQR